MGRGSVVDTYVGTAEGGRDEERTAVGAAGRARPKRARTDAQGPSAPRSGTPPVKVISEGPRSRISLDRDAINRRLLATADVAAAGLALNIAIIMGGGTPTFAVVATALLVVLVAKVTGLYDRDEYVLRKTTLDEAPSVASMVTAFTLLVWLLDDVFVVGELTKTTICLLWLGLICGILTLRALARRVALTVARPERCIALGSPGEARAVAEKFEARSHATAELVGRVPLCDDAGTDTLGCVDDLHHIIRRERVDRVIICPTVESSSQMLDTIRLVKALGVKVSLMPRLLEVVGSTVEFDDFGGMTFLGVRRYELSKSSALLKRSLDMAGAGAGVLLLAPLFATFAAAVKLTSSGPVFFRQARIGRGGKTFQMLKFRTMFDGADEQKAALRDRNEADGFFKIRDDPRITRVGKLLRRTSLDELPQLINVLRGEMSLVGPRPLVAEEDASLQGWQRGRLDVTPGITGAWQVLGSSRVPVQEMVTIDYLYRTNWSLWLDVKILLRTIPHVLGRRGM
jgi:exopolysaccharide biosynthesis polyprenyl glycosylphosphotransferase